MVMEEFMALGLPAMLGISIPILIIILVWSAVWKGIALWKSARAGQMVWFIVLLVVNTIGILEIIYLAFFQKGKRK